MVYAYDVLNRLKWKDRLPGCEIVILHRGAPGDRKVIPGNRVTEIRKSCLIYTNERGEKTLIPYHRVTEIRIREKVIWKRD